MTNLVVPADRMSKYILTGVCFLSFEMVAVMLVYFHSFSFDDDFEYGPFSMEMATMVGYIVNGFLFQVANKRIGIIVSLFVMPFMAIPIASRMHSFFWYSSHMAFGFLYSMFDVCVKSLLLDIWRGHIWSASFFQGLYLYQSIGGLSASRTVADGQQSYSSRMVSIFIPVLIAAVIHLIVFVKNVKSSKKNGEEVTVSQFQPEPSDLRGLRPPEGSVEKSFIFAGLATLSFALMLESFFVYGMIFPDANRSVSNYDYFVYSRVAAQLFAFVACFNFRPDKLTSFSLLFAILGVPTLFLSGPEVISKIGSSLFGFAQGAFPTLLISAMEQEKHLTISIVALFLCLRNVGFISAVFFSWFFALFFGQNSNSRANLIVIHFGLLTTLIFFIVFYKHKNRRLPSVD